MALKKRIPLKICAFCLVLSNSKAFCSTFCACVFFVVFFLNAGSQLCLIFFFFLVQFKVLAEVCVESSSIRLDYLFITTNQENIMRALLSRGSHKGTHSVSRFGLENAFYQYADTLIFICISSSFPSEVMALGHCPCDTVLDPWSEGRRFNPQKKKQEKFVLQT